ncbi:cell wall-binding protein EntB [Bacillus toyonensis]|uniref:cell wall-binding protein EntB n=1 Tax=Bacillus toyonensis TaxID=155322 RepID=UPI000BECE64C|nr:cell wall-binding protein EntB [Bacillus toyonensis]PEC08213.1 enterotoxin [Bacillus toyonensis]PEL58439.1 enterotoxin [Bacillus toyonensis]
MKKIIGAATATVFGLGAFTTSAIAETIVTADVLNVREKPTTESKVIEKVKEGQKLKVINTEEGWSKIDLNGKELFVSSEFTKDIYHVTANLLNVRSEANTESEILGRLKKDDVIESTHQAKDGWLQFEYKGKTAYANVSFLSSTAPSEKKAGEKTKQVAKVQKAVKAKEEAKTQKVAKIQEIAKTKETTKMLEEVKVQEVAKGKEEKKVQEIAKPKEETKVQEIAKPKEEAKVKEVEKVKEEAKAQEIAKAKEEAKVQEIAKAKEEAKVKEVEKVKEEAKAQEIARAKEEAKAKEESKNNTQSAKRELTVVATAYTADPSENGTYGGRVLTAMGHDLTANPNMRIIAVDPKVIPLGSKVWVEGYGEAIAGDTGSAIKGNRIDVLMGSKSKAMNWGRQTVKVKIL